MAEPADPFALLLADIPDYALFLVDNDGKVTRWSASAEKVFGYPAGEIIGRHFSCLYPPEDGSAAIVNEELEMASAHGRMEDIAWRVRRDKSRFWAGCVICPLRDEQGSLLGFSHIIRDITERKKAEEALRQKEAELS